MDRMTGKPIIKPLLFTALFCVIVMACLLVGFLSMTVGTAYSIASWLTSTPRVADLVYRTSTGNATVVAQIPATLEPTVNTSLVTQPATEKPVDTSTPVPAATVTPAPSPTLESTTPPTFTPVPVTPTLDVAAQKLTQEAQLTPMAADMKAVIEDLYNSKTIKKSDGTYLHLPDYQGEWANPDNLKFEDTGVTLSDFVLRADVEWQVDGNQGEWAESGCGVVFRADEMGNYYMIYLSLDGRGRLVRKLDGSSIMLGRSTIYDVDRNLGKEKFMLIVENDRVRYFVDDKVKFDKYGQPQIGKLQWTIVSGNKSGFGTSCKISNIDIWKFGN